MITRTEAIGNYLKANTHDDLARLYNHDMEVQVNVARGNGEKESGVYKGREFVVWTDGVSKWKSFRIPYNAATEPEYKDVQMAFSLDQHAEGIGMTGWDWKNKVSRWVAYDFDSILGHSEKHAKKLTAADLDKIKEVVQGVPWVTVRKSTGGSGLHLYVLLKPVSTANHTEHAALARSILNMMSAVCGFEFSTKVDVCGGNMWVWHRKMKGTDGLTLLKAGTALEDVPPNWKDHVGVVTGRTQRVALQDIAEPDMFDQLVGQRSKIPLDESHKKVIQHLTDSNCYWWWDNNMWMLVCHTYDLKEAHAKLQLRGKFDTVAAGSERGQDHNCFCYPLRNGGWVVRRYSPGTQEKDTWQQDGKGWTRCFLNREVDVPTACQVAGGVEHPSGGYYFASVEQISKALGDLRVNPDVPDFIKGERNCILKPGKGEGKIVVLIGYESKDPQHPQPGWILDKKKWWTKVFNVKSNESQDELENKENYDDLVRHVVTEAGEDAGWLINGKGNWREEPLPHVRAALGPMGYGNKEINEIVGIQVINAWTIVNRPFESEYPGNREWNRKAAQLAYTPSRYSDGLAFPTWNSILEHCGSGLDEAIKQNDWCQRNKVLTGRDYLAIWVASLLKHPTYSLPYLFFWSTEQNTGKSSFHMALSYLLTSGYMRADNALDSGSGFNGELIHAIICVIEETNLKKASASYNRIKDWVTSPQILIHPKNVTPYMIVNTTHWIQCANDYRACPVFPGDTRITMINVPQLDPEKLIPEKELTSRLKAEAPDFLAYILKVEIPPSNDRLHLPIINTKEKAQAAEKNKSSLEDFLDEKTYKVPGNTILYSEFYAKFIEDLDPEERPSWTKKRVSNDLPIWIAKGRLTTNPNVHVANIAWEPSEVKGGEWYTDGTGFLRQKPMKANVPKST